MNIIISLETIGNDKRLSLFGEIDAYTAPQLREKLIPLTEMKGVTIIVDLSGVNYMDSTGLGVFIGAYKSCQKNESHLKLVGMTERVERLFDITGLTEIMDIEMTVRGERN